MTEEGTLISGYQYLGGLFVILYRAIRKRLLLMIVAMLVVMAITYFATPRPARIYGAQASVQIGRVGGAEAMVLQAAVARVNALSFKRRVLQSMNLPAPENDRAARLISDGLAARSDMSDTMTVSVRAFDEQQARQVLDLVVHLLNEEQEKVLKPILADVNAQIAESDENIVNLLKIREALLALTKGSAIGAAAETQAGDLRLLDILSRSEQMLMTARAERRELASRLGASKTYPTAIVDDVFLSSTPASPRPSRAAILAAGLTFVGFLLYALLSRRRSVRPD